MELIEEGKGSKGYEKTEFEGEIRVIKINKDNEFVIKFLVDRANGKTVDRQITVVFNTKEYLDLFVGFGKFFSEMINAFMKLHQKEKRII